MTIQDHERKPVIFLPDNLESMVAFAENCEEKGYLNSAKCMREEIKKLKERENVT